MIPGRWVDHAPPWLAWGALASTGAYTLPEMAVMALPLLAAGAVEAGRLDLSPHRRALEMGALGVFLVLVLLRIGVLPTVVNTLFTLCGVRLCLPREMPQRRQVLLMGFLLFLSTAVSTSDMDFLFWSLAWTAGGAAVLVQQQWEASAARVPVPAGPAPLGRIPVWTGAILLAGLGFFVILPRLRAGVRGLPVGLQAPVGSQAGLSTVLDLSGRGPIQGGGEVALRVMPDPDGSRDGRHLGLLKAMVLEDLEGDRWERSPDTPRRLTAGWHRPLPGHPALEATLFINPGPVRALPLPYGLVDLDPPEGAPLRGAAGGAIAWAMPFRRILPLHIRLAPLAGEPERTLDAERAAHLTHGGDASEAALRWSLRTAPGDLEPAALAARLSQELRTYRYTLDNPSGTAAHPLEDFLERTRAGHCEYFASALAVGLRARKVPARVVTGYRLGPWIPEGGYWLVTQNEAHSWVEFYDREARLWRVADPTPPAPPSALGAGGWQGLLSRWTDAVRFRWDRHVVRFSDEDQMQGLAWAQGAWDRFRVGPGLGALLKAAAAVGALAALAWAAWRFMAGRTTARLLGRIPELAPLLRAAGPGAVPLEGETARAWIERLAQIRPERSRPLAALAQEADAVAYGGKGRTALARMAEEEGRAWRSPRT